MIPTWALVLIIVIIFFGVILGLLHYYRPNYFREITESAIGGNEKILLGAIVPKRCGLVDTDNITKVS